ncbi:MAG: hypothetical protein N0A00_02135 [Candidatus Bathyarchaeota archaeon]|nr:hypothetical protein [Candidatus Bathyarchaeota archaeon]
MKSIKVYFQGCASSEWGMTEPSQSELMRMRNYDEQTPIKS